MTAENKEQEKPIRKKYYKDRYKKKNDLNKNIQKPKNINQKNNPNKGTVLSIIIPLLNEEESLPELALQIESEMKNIRNLNGRYEVLFIDDGSTDDSYKEIKAIHNRNKRFKAIRFRRNYGKSAALSVGFKNAKGSIVVTMDADLQDDPSEIYKMVEKIKDGYDLVSGWKKKRKDPIIKVVTSKLYNFVTSLFCGLKLHDFNCGIKAYRSEVVKSLQVYGDMHRYLPALAHLDGFSVTEMEVNHRPRRYGKTKFGATRFIKGYLDLLTVMFTTRYLKRPLHFFGTIGSVFALIGFGIDLYLSIEWFLGNTALSNRPLAIFGIALIIVGVQLLSMGLIGEMLVKSSLENQKYSIKERL